MPGLPLEAEQVQGEMIRVLHQAWENIVTEQEELLRDPMAIRRRIRLVEMRKRIESMLDEVDIKAHTWARDRFPLVYAHGAAAGAASTGETLSSWTQLNKLAMQQLSTDMFNDVLKATKYTRTDTKRFVREIGKQFSELTVSTDRTAAGAARELVRKLIADHGIKSVRYANGATHGLGTYGEMLVRTKSALAYNEGTIRGGQEFGVKYWEVFDGPDCGWSSHDDTTLAAGMIVTSDEALSYPIAHPNCRRAFGGRPDIVTRRQAAAAPPSVTPEQVQAQRLQDQARQDRQSRRSGSRARSRRAAPAHAEAAVESMSRKQMLTELQTLGYTGPTSYTKPQLGRIVEQQRARVAGNTSFAQVGESAFQQLQQSRATGMTRFDKLGSVSEAHRDPYAASMINDHISADPIIREQLKDTWDKLSTAFPGLGEADFPSLGLVKGPIGQFDPNSRMIKLNPEYFKNAQQVRDRQRSYSISKFKTTIDQTHSIRYTMIHEFGHALDFTLAVLPGDERRAMWAELAAYWKPGVQTGSLSSIQLLRVFGELRVTSELSKYAWENEYEFIAEAFAQYMLSATPSESALIVGRYFERVLGSR